MRGKFKRSESLRIIFSRTGTAKRVVVRNDFVRLCASVQRRSRHQVSRSGGGLGRVLALRYGVYLYGGGNNGIREDGGSRDGWKAQSRVTPCRDCADHNR